MGKKFRRFYFRRFYKSARGPLAWILSLILVLQMFPAQGIQYALAETTKDAVVSEAPVVDEATAGDEEVGLVVETSGVTEGVTEGEAEGAPEEEPVVEPAVNEDPVDDAEGESAPEPAPAAGPEVPETDPETDSADETEPTDDATEPTRATDTAWTVTFYNRDARVIQTSEITKGQAIGDAFPKVPFYEDHTGEWYVGIVDEYGKFTYRDCGGVFGPNDPMRPNPNPCGTALDSCSPGRS